MYAALLLGIAGSLHCVGMCGPLMLALPFPREEGKQRNWLRLLEYHSGRILTYALLGVLFGLLGKGIALAGAQKFISLGAGIFMIVTAVFAWKIEQLAARIPGISHVRAWVQRNLSALIQQRPHGATFFFGVLNGMLPCGMVYAALAGAIASTTGLEGALFMLCFGLGTVPLMLLAGLWGRSFSNNVRQRFRVFQPLLLTVAGLLLIQRGLHLDLSIFDAAVPKAVPDCH